MRIRWKRVVLSNTKKPAECFQRKTANSRGNRPLCIPLYKTFQMIMANSLAGSSTIEWARFADIYPNAAKPVNACTTISPR